MSRSRAKASRPDPAAEARQAGLDAVRQHVAFRYLSWKAVLDEHHDHVPSDGWAVVSSDGSVYLHPRRHGSPGEWAWVVAHALLHLGLGHAPDAERSVVVRPQPGIARAAAQCVVANRFLAGLHFGQPPQPTPADLPDGDEDRLTQQWAVHGVPAQFQDCGSGGSAIDVLLQPGCGWPDPVDWQAQFAAGLTDAVAEAIEEAGGSTPRRPDGSRRRKTEWERALGWFVSHYPLLGAVASGMTIVADRALAQQWDISVAAVNASAGEIYINPLASLDEEEWQFVLGHEMLHAALRHADRCGARDPYLYNVACDYVVNLWLVEMRVGTMPYGCLYDASLAGLSAEEVYDRLAGDLRRLRRLATLRGKGRPDVLGDPLPRLGEAGRGVELDDFYRRALLTGLTYHQSQERGCCRVGWSRRSARLSTLRFRGTPSSRAGSTSTFQPAFRSGRSPAHRVARLPHPIFPGLDAICRRKPSRPARSASCSTPQRRCRPGSSARPLARSPRTPRLAMCGPRGSSSVTPPRTTPAIFPWPRLPDG